MEDSEFIRELSEAGRRQEDRYAAHVSLDIRRMEEKFTAEWRSIILSLSRDRSLGPVISPSRKVLEDYFPALSYLGWEACHWGPALDIEVGDDYALALVAYLSCRLMDDGIDGHVEYRAWLSKQRQKSLFGYFSERLGERHASGLSVLTGSWILNAALRRMRKKGHTESADLVSTLFESIVPGVIAESACERPVTRGTYRAIVKKKSVAYNMILYRIFLSRVDSELRTRMLRSLELLVESNQWLSDLWDMDEDMARGQVSIFSIPGMTSTKVQREIFQNLRSAWLICQTLPPEVRDALGGRMAQTAALALNPSAP